MKKDQTWEIGGNKAEQMNPQVECKRTEIICYTALGQTSSVFELLFRIVVNP